MEDLKVPEACVVDHQKKEPIIKTSSLISSPSTVSVPKSSSDSKDSDLDIEKATPLPPKRQSHFLRHLRHTFLNVYRRLFSLVFILNLIGLIILLSRHKKWLSSAPLGDFATAAAANIMVALLIRQDYVVNTLFKLCWLVPFSAPLKIRCMLAKIYEYGGVHSGCAVSAVIWFCLFTGFLTNEFVKGGALRDPATLTFTYLLIVLLMALCVTAYPRLRFRSHNTFEFVHRWGGWFSLGLFWVELVLFARTQRVQNGPSLGRIFVKVPAMWFLLISSFHAIYPWLRLHKLHVRPEKLSNHAIRLHLQERLPKFVGIRISDSPLAEWHSFAVFPPLSAGGESSILISNAGDWTSATILNPRPYYWIKGVPVTGVLCMAQIFRSIVIVATGSGIGPCLAVMQDIPMTKVRVIWSTKNPTQTYGESICKAVKETDPRAIIWDTGTQGRPDLVRMAWEVYKEEEAEAVFVISNPKLTRKVVYGMESRGVPAFGPVWDS